MGYLRQIQGGPVMDPGGTPLPNTRIALVLIDPVNHRPVHVADVPGGHIPLGHVGTETDADGMVDFHLWPNSRGSVPTQYAVRMPSTAAEAYFTALEEDDAVATWEEFLAGNRPMGYDSLLRQHLDDDDVHLLPGDREAIESASQLVASVAGEDLSGHRMVRIESGSAWYASNADQSHAGKVAGITTGAAVATDPVSVQTQGLMTEPSWSWTPGPVYLGADGALTQTPPTSGFLLIVGRAIDTTKLLIGIQTPVLRS